MIIDFSAHNEWMFCPAKWYEKYVNKLMMSWPKAQRDDALALGTLVHEGLRIWQMNKVVAIPEEVVTDVSPTKECYHLALELVYGYAKQFPEERWPLIFCEEPLRFPLALFQDACPDECNGFGAELEGLAKIDSYFYVPEPTVVSSGFGMEFLLSPGWWIHEYKTKSPDIPIGLYMQSWEMNLQASYQMMALKHTLQSAARAKDYSVPWPEVQGVLVNVLEKPKRYIPKRKCIPCNDSYEFYTWLPTGTGEYACPSCGHRQKLTPLREMTPAKPPAYYRIIVTRNTDELEADKHQIIQVGQRMIDMERQGLDSEPWTKRNCVSFFPKRVCEFFGPHKNLKPAGEFSEYIPVPDYRGLTKVDPLT